MKAIRRFYRLDEMKSLCIVKNSYKKVYVYLQP